MIDAIVFDKDGTLFDFRASWGRWTVELLDRLARDPSHGAAMADALGFLPAENSFRLDSVVVSATPAEIARVLLPYLPGQDPGGLTDSLNKAAESVVMAEAVPLAPLFGVLRARGLRLGVATNDAEAPARAHLGRHGLADLVDFVAGYDSGHGAKPGPGMCLAFAQAMGLDPGRVLMVGDSHHDIDAGRAAGMRTVAVLTGIATEADLAGHADAILPDIGALPAWLDLARGDHAVPAAELI